MWHIYAPTFNTWHEKKKNTKNKKVISPGKGHERFNIVKTRGSEHKAIHKTTRLNSQRTPTEQEKEVKISPQTVALRNIAQDNYTIPQKRTFNNYNWWNRYKGVTPTNTPYYTNIKTVRTRCFISSLHTSNTMPFKHI